MSDENTPVNDDICFVMRRLLFEDDSTPINNNRHDGGATNPLPNLP